MDEYTVSTYQRHGLVGHAMLVLPPSEEPPLSIICPNDHRRWWREDTEPLADWLAKRSTDLPPTTPGTTTPEA